MDTLKKYKDKPLYEVPENFFEKFQQDVMQRVTWEEKRRKIQKKWISAVSIAASFALIIALSYFIFLNRDTNNHFYVHEKLPLPEDSIILLETNQLADATEVIIMDTGEIIATKESVSYQTSKTPVVEETIVYRAVDYYIDDIETENFYETMYDLECYYDY